MTLSDLNSTVVALQPSLNGPIKKISNRFPLMVIWGVVVVVLVPVAVVVVVVPVASQSL